MNWGKWIIVAFVLFAGFIGTLMTICMRQDISLVSKEYYKDELAYQDQIVRLTNASRLTNKPSIKLVDQFLLIDFTSIGDIESGKLILFRPSDPSMDKLYVFNREMGVQSFPLSSLQKGMYRAKIQWSAGGKEYYLEEVIHI